MPGFNNYQYIVEAGAKQSPAKKNPQMADEAVKSDRSRIRPRHEIEIIRGGKEYFDLLLELINGAAESIHLQTYIYDDDETGQQVANALKAAVQRKVAVYLLADGYASQVMSRHFINELKAAGIQFRYFEPLLKSRHF
jgi:cardiolipin synthase